MGKVKDYLRGRVVELLPKRDLKWKDVRQEMNPIPVLRLINSRTWLFVLSAFGSLTIEATDFFIVALNVKKLSGDFNVKTASITWGITLALMTRTIGAVIFGYVGDRYGQKTSFLVNLSIMMALQIIIGFATSFRYFLACRALFGIALGGCFGTATTQCLDDLPKEAYGWVSGVFQQAYALGYLCAVVLTRALADTTHKTWRSCFWFVSGTTLMMLIFRTMLPETDAFLERKRIKEQKKLNNEQTTSTIMQIYQSFVKEWYMVIYMVLLMIGFNYFSHASQDLFPTMLTNQLGFSADRSTVTNCLANIGAITGGIVLPHFSSLSSRRFIIILAVLLAACVVYPWGFIHDNSINASVFFLQMFVQGSWGLVPFHLHALAPASETQSFFIGVSYQLGNLASSAASTIESTLGERYPIKTESGEILHNYGLVMAILVYATIGYMLIVVFFGPESNPNRTDLSSDIEEKSDVIISLHSHVGNKKGEYDDGKDSI
ncbi:monocarboxylate/H+ symporter Ecym_6024 [Eremothecium cymbalariae DBVPG|uniref:Major facilitator superfamily (MFS) profile domain-containing protein n=1 Tax=Eremothecium cymbalariae (strain CBS 270.75 / DBVPG 7215 / KCTC 17166 / NRRL Y-17582) TaxID=931890 RepID=G8JUV0_ERECY|nr:hypothetical protein Ecym_6024 [Eremothecium cymbalariae DBVPG\